VNVYLGTLAEAWLKYVHDLNETAGLDEGYNGNDQWPAISKQWTDTWIHVKETNQKLEGESLSLPLSLSFVWPLTVFLYISLSLRIVT